MNWHIDPQADLTGLRKMECYWPRAPYGQLVATDRCAGRKIVYFLPGPNDPDVGEPCELPEHRIRRESRIVFIVEAELLADFRWVREFRRDCDKPDGRLGRSFWGQVIPVAYSETTGVPTDGRWLRRIWGFWKLGQGVEGIDVHTPTQWGDIAADPTIVAGHFAKPHNFDRRLSNAERQRACQTLNNLFGR